MKNTKIKVFYTEKQVNLNKNIISTTSRSPLKPYLLMKTLEGTGYGSCLDIDGNFSPLEYKDFLIAHTKSYVEGFFNGTPGICERNSLPWSKELAESVRYTNASLYNALRYAFYNPNTVCLSPTSGFHHARPSGGSGFCTFAGQVIAAVKLYRETGAVGAVLDLDGHFGNSIEDCRAYVPELNHAIPMGFNVNPRGSNGTYVNDLVSNLQKIEDAVMAGEISYVMWCHGADSHDWDDLGGQVDTEHWTKCSAIFYAWVDAVDKKLELAGKRPLSVVLSLFGGYRKDDYGSVISLHMSDINECLNTLCGHSLYYQMRVSKKKYTSEVWVDGMPLSVLKMIDRKFHSKKFMTDEEFKKTKMTLNETLVLDFLKENKHKSFTGHELGAKIKNWENHSMSKWAKLLVRRRLVDKVGNKYYKASDLAEQYNNPSKTVERYVVQG